MRAIFQGCLRIGNVKNFLKGMQEVIGWRGFSRTGGAAVDSKLDWYLDKIRGKGEGKNLWGETERKLESILRSVKGRRTENPDHGKSFTGRQLDKRERHKGGRGERRLGSTIEKQLGTPREWSNDSEKQLRAS